MGIKNMILTKGLTFEYIRRDEEGNVEGINTALDDVSIDIQKGQFIAILGHNGSGKSTFAKHLNALVMPTEGTVYVDGMDTKDADNTLKVRQTAGMVFQNPDNQIVATIVEEDVAFGPENLGVPTDEIWERVNKALESVNMTMYRGYSPNKLSGGQKQRVAIAGVLAMKPKCIVLDEATAMLDPSGRKEVMSAIIELNKVEKITVILITHYMDEAVLADKIFVMDKGRIAMEGTPRQVFSHVEEIRELRLDVPAATAMAYELRKAGYNIPKDILTRDELVEAVCRLY